MSLEKVEEIVLTLDLNAQGKWNERLNYYTFRETKQTFVKVTTYFLTYFNSHYLIVLNISFN